MIISISLFGKSYRLLTWYKHITSISSDPSDIQLTFPSYNGYEIGNTIYICNMPLSILRDSSFNVEKVFEKFPKQGPPSFELFTDGFPCRGKYCIRAQMTNNVGDVFSLYDCYMTSESEFREFLEFFLQFYSPERLLEKIFESFPNFRYDTLVSIINMFLRTFKNRHAEILDLIFLEYGYFRWLPFANVILSFL
jgi:hypothetical protein